MQSVEIAESYPIPDTLVRFGIRQALKRRLRTEQRQTDKVLSDLREMQEGQISLASQQANSQHYELPSEFFVHVLGKNLKYSSCTFPDGITSLDLAEDYSLNEIAERAQIQDGHSILELGCGWGSFSLYAAKKFPNSQITAVSNSKTQKDFILTLAKQRQLENIEVITADINNLTLTKKFDRIVSVEMFEHLRNYSVLFQKISSWLNDHGLLFVHIFCHHQMTYFFDESAKDQWMAKYFFAGGTMPAKNLFYQYNQYLKIVNQWDVSGRNYQKTADAWARNLKENRHLVMPILKKTYGERESVLWFRRWLIFFLACSELFGYSQGREWLVSHYLFSKQEA